MYETTHAKERGRAPPNIQLQQCLVDFIINTFSDENNDQEN